MIAVYSELPANQFTMERLSSFQCHSYLDNNSVCILEVSIPDDRNGYPIRDFHWFLFQKTSLTFQEMQLKSADASSSVQERFFDLGYLKYKGDEGVFIVQQQPVIHPLRLIESKQVPDTYLTVVRDHLLKVTA